MIMKFISPLVNYNTEIISLSIVRNIANSNLLILQTCPSIMNIKLSLRIELHGVISSHGLFSIIPYIIIWDSQLEF